MTATHTAKTAQRPDSYLELIKIFPLRPIRTTRQYDDAIRVMEKLAVRGEDDLNAGEADYLSVLSNLIEAYDDVHYPMPSDKRPPYEKLAALMESAGVSRIELAELLDTSKSTVHMILRGARGISKVNIRVLSERFKVSPAYFL